MTLPLKPEPIAALYEFLRSLPPFTRLKMPPADEVEFSVIRDRTCFAQWDCRDDGTHRIRISESAVGQTMTLVMSLGHEMVHLAVDILGKNTGGNANTHNAAFRRMAARFCKVHGLDLKAFY